MKEQEITLGELFAFATKHLPMGWELTLSMTQGGVSLDLYDREWNSVEVGTDDQDTSEMVVSSVNHARKAAGLNPVPWR